MDRIFYIMEDIVSNRESEQGYINFATNSFKGEELVYKGESMTFKSPKTYQLDLDKIVSNADINLALSVFSNLLFAETWEKFEEMKHLMKEVE